MDATDFGGLDGLTPEQIKALLATNADPYKLGQLQDQGKAADRLREAAFAGAPGTTVGHQYLADVGGSLAAGMGALKGNMMAKQADKDAAGIFSNQASAEGPFIQQLLDALRKKKPSPYGIEST
jgi:hypothetical protein